jgi:hypothetical protein
LPDDERLREHQYSVGMIVLSVNLARAIGFRTTTRALAIFFDWLGVDVKIPTYPTIRNWVTRVGVARMKPGRSSSDAYWLVDHTNQIGREKVLCVLKVDQLPPPGTSLRHEDVDVIALRPQKDTGRDAVAKVYRRLVDEFGLPRAIVTDGAVELREPAIKLNKDGKKAVVLGDFKHYLANRFEALLNRDSAFQEFSTNVGRARSLTQQTELAHLVPPPKRPKARFMNLAPLLKWAVIMLDLLDHPEADGRKGVSDERLKEKLGWLQDFAAQIDAWNQCQNVISKSLTFVNQQALFQGAAKQLQQQLQPYAAKSLAKELIESAVQFIRDGETQLKPGERLPLTTEILESTFALYKQLESQHSKTGFTTLLPALPTLLKPTNPHEIRQAFAVIANKHVKEWIQANIPVTVNQRKLRTYHEYQERQKKTKRKRATSIAAAA